ncbi:sensor histidine kinase [Streptomyces sp. NBC_00249]|uniref:sensor histidine kinase n=1 Tax=Streptomyces sp. NBC_00249 TaxID=2975690 RepID=UPI00225C271D|nr:sensor histidine kinase [Streptomyces sp. NBC_00249]MCX5196092.1 sensor histidine kinase [Streptomyces sp. NBC_00249]
MAEVTEPRSGAERVLRALHQDPLAAAHPTRNDAVLAAGVAALSAAVAYADTALRPDALGWTLLVCCALLLAARRRHPVGVLMAVVACIAPYQLLGNAHAAPLPAGLIALYTVAVTGTVRRTVTVGVCVVGFAVTAMSSNGVHRVLDVLRTSGWLVAALVLGVAVRNYRRYLAEERARAGQDADRKIAEERLRIARDLHDLLAHSITLIGVRTSVAAHVLAVDPDRLDRAAVAEALDSIADTCREARAELRTTLTVLRADERGPLPDLAGLPDLVRAAEAELTLDTDGVHVPAAVGAAAYRIVQESLTNAVRHAGPGTTVRVRVAEADGTLRVTVSDDGRGPVADSTTAGFGIVGMGERARSVGGTVRTGPRSGGGFEVAANLPLPPRPPEASA